jgi:hypothetical protein
VIGDRESKDPRSSKSSLGWVLVTLISISIKFPRDKLQNISKAFIAHVGAPFCRTDSIDNMGRPTFKIRDDRLGLANQFKYQNMDFKVMTYNNRNHDTNKKLGRGIAQIPDSMSFDDFRNKMKVENPDIKEIYQNYEYKNNKKYKTNTVAITFNKEDIPLSIKSNKNDEILPIMPAQMSILRCQNCQAFGHNKSKCRNTIKCPHCAGLHGHRNCPNKNLKKCANCFSSHSAAYKGCPTYLRYVEKINQTNSQIKKDHIIKCDQAGAPRILSPHSETIIKTITEKVFGKNKDEIEKILRLHIFDLDTSMNKQEYQKTNKGNPVQTQKQTMTNQAEQQQQNKTQQQQQQNALEQQKTQNKQKSTPHNSNNRQQQTVRGHYMPRIYPRHQGYPKHHHMGWPAHGYFQPPHPHHYYIRHLNNNYPPQRRF